MTVREEIAETIRAYMMQLPPIADKPRRVELVIEYPSVTERHEIIKEIEKMTAFEDTKAETETAESLKTSGDRTTLAGGNCTTLAGGNYAKLAGGNYAKLTGGNYATLAGGNYATLAGGEKSLIVGGDGSIAKGGIGSVILLVEKDGDDNITAYKAIKVDGKRYKADVYYTLGADGEVKAAGRR